MRSEKLKEKKDQRLKKETDTQEVLNSIFKEVSDWPQWLQRNAQPIIETNFEVDRSTEQFKVPQQATLPLYEVTADSRLGMRRTFGKIEHALDFASKLLQTSSN